MVRFAAYLDFMLIDLRSDTVTRPTPGMLEAMFNAPVGDDVFGDDPTVNSLEAKAAGMFGMEAALFCASGTMTNQIAIKVLTRPGDEVICDKLSHIYNFEGGGIAFNSGASVRLIEGDRGRIHVSQIPENINDPGNVHFARTSLVSLENTMNKGGGSYYRLDDIAAIRELCNRQQLSLHLDGARLFNALVETGESPAAYGKLFDTISICLSKGLGAPVGSLLLGTRDIIRQARRIRKVMGGGWRQAGYLAAAGIYALDNHIDRLKEDHRRAGLLADTLKTLPYVEEVLPQETNIVIFRLKDGIKTEQVISRLAENNILVSGFGPGMIRMVTHLDFTEEMLEKCVEKLREGW